MQLDVQYCEPQLIARLIRATSAHSSMLYVALNLLFGAALPVLPQPNEDDSYRLVVLATLTPGPAHA